MNASPRDQCRRIDDPDASGGSAAIASRIRALLQSRKSRLDRDSLEEIRDLANRMARLAASRQEGQVTQIANAIELFATAGMVDRFGMRDDLEKKLDELASRACSLALADKTLLPSDLSSLTQAASARWGSS